MADHHDIPSVRLASGVEMQQRWPSSQSEQQQQVEQPKTSEPPRLIEMAPSRGIQGTVVTLVVQSLPHQLVPVKLAFNSLVVDTKQMQAQGITSLVAAVPPFQQTHSTTANVPISICILDKDSVTETWPVAEFTYEFETKETINVTTADTTPTLTTASTNSSNENSSIEYSSERRDTVQAGGYQSSSRENFLGGSSYVNFYQQQQPVNNYNNLTNQQQMPQYAYQQQQFNDSKYNTYRQNNAARPQQPAMDYNNNIGMNLFNPNNSNYNMLTSFEQNESIPLSAPNVGFNTPSPASQQQQQPMPQHHRQASYGCNKTSVHVPSTSVANYQPYPGLVSRANLKIMGDLDSMAKNWQPDEWEHRRRLVQFWREQHSNEIRCTFDPISQGERITSNSGHIVVSCIYWAERNDCFITSVDCIHLLESLMDIRFSVEEKNRVRRNLEGFRPLTVSKCKAESAEFFKLIMSFPNPKPRNIEKDVKVFPWKTLPYALKKIVTKYTASSYNQAGSRRTQLSKTPSSNSVLPTPPITNNGANSYMTASALPPPPSQQQQQSMDSMNNFYPPQNNFYSQQSQYSNYQSQTSNELPVSYATSAPTYQTSYTQPSPSSASSPRMQYPYNDMMNNSIHLSESTSSNSEPPAAAPVPRRASVINRQDFSIL